MRHQWSDGETFLGLIVSECQRCGAYRTRKRKAGVDYVNIGGICLDMVGKARGWNYRFVPRGCREGEATDVDQ